MQVPAGSGSTPVLRAYIHTYTYMHPHLQANGDEGTRAPLDPAQSGGSAQQAAGFLQQAVRDEASKEQRLQRELSPEQYSLWKEKQMKAQRVSQLQPFGDMLPAAMGDSLPAHKVGELQLLWWGCLPWHLTT